jgi:thioesterase domain-containing protein
VIIPPEQIKEFVGDKIDRIEFIHRMGVKLLKSNNGNIKISAPLKGNENHVGIMYAGALFSVAEFIVGPFFWSLFDQDRFYPIVKEMTISYKRPADTDVTVEIDIPKEEIIRIEKEASLAGKSEFILETQIKNISGETVSKTSGIYQIRAIKT